MSVGNPVLQGPPWTCSSIPSTRIVFYGCHAEFVYWDLEGSLRLDVLKTYLCPILNIGSEFFWKHGWTQQSASGSHIGSPRDKFAMLPLRVSLSSVPVTLHLFKSSNHISYIYVLRVQDGDQLTRKAKKCVLKWIIHSGSGLVWHQNLSMYVHRGPAGDSSPAPVEKSWGERIFWQLIIIVGIFCLRALVCWNLELGAKITSWNWHSYGFEFPLWE